MRNMHRIIGAKSVWHFIMIGQKKVSRTNTISTTNSANSGYSPVAT
jgi:hypothetical protein